MPKGIYARERRAPETVLQSFRVRLEEMSIPEPNTGCWLFTGCLHKLGYGVISESKTRKEKAHRASYRAFKGEIPDGLHVLHRCDVRCCVNPDHLSLGTHIENMADMARRSRANPKGYKSKRFPRGIGMPSA